MMHHASAVPMPLPAMMTFGQRDVLSAFDSSTVLTIGATVLIARHSSAVRR
jgi:hypothetical protein